MRRSVLAVAAAELAYAWLLTLHTQAQPGGAAAASSREPGAAGRAVRWCRVALQLAAVPGGLNAAVCSIMNQLHTECHTGLEKYELLVGA